MASSDLQRWLENFIIFSSFLSFWWRFWPNFLIFPIFNFRQFFGCPGHSNHHFWIPGAPTTSRIWSNINFEAYQKNRFFHDFLHFYQNTDLDFAALGIWVISKIWSSPSGKSKIHILISGGTSNFSIWIAEYLKKSQISHPRLPICDSPYHGHSS